jgi:hypothetical protein
MDAAAILLEASKIAEQMEAPWSAKRAALPTSLFGRRH